MKYSLHIHADRLVNDRFGYYSKVDPLYHLSPLPQKNGLFYYSPRVSLLYYSEEEMVSTSFPVLPFLWIAKIISN